MAYEKMRERQRIAYHEYVVWHAVEDKMAFWDLLEEIGRYRVNGESSVNRGKGFEPSEEEVWDIIAKYIERRRSEQARRQRRDDMQAAIYEVMGIVC